MLYTWNLVYYGKFNSKSHKLSENCKGETNQLEK